MSNPSHKTYLQKRNLRATSQRLGLMDIINGYGSAMPYSLIKEELKEIDRVTVYRNLDDLTKHGILHKAYQDEADVYYALCPDSCTSTTHHHNHIHFKCTSCGAVTCEKSAYTLNLKESKLQIDSVSIEIKGKCGQCSN